MTRQASVHGKSQAQQSLRQQAQNLKQESLFKPRKGRKFTSHPDLELAKQASKVQAMKDEAREHLLDDEHNPFHVEPGYGQKLAKWAKGNRLVSIPLSILAGVVTTAIVKALIGPKDKRLQ